jgi:DNA polymerase
MDALAMLRLQVEWGADEALADAPIDRLRAAVEAGRQQGQGEGKGGGQRLPGPHSTPAPHPGRPAASASGTPPSGAPASGTPAERAAASAGQAGSIEELRAALAAFDGCALRNTAANLVFAAGDPNPDLLLIGEPPGEAEDRSGTPFAGPDGVLLDRMLASIGLTRDALLLTPLIPWRPPGGRLPNPGEIALCLPFLHRLVALAAPRRIVLAGALAARTLLGPTRRRPAAAWTEIAVPGVSPPLPALVMPGPAMVARTPSARREAWAALRLLRRTLDADLAES